MDVLFTGGSICICRLVEPADQTSLIRAFQEVALEQEWEIGTELSEPNRSSLYFAAYCAGQLAGGIEIRKPDSTGFLPVYSTWPEISERAIDSPAHVVILAITRKFRNQPRLLWTLCTEVWRSCRLLGIKNLLMEVPVANYRVYCRFGWSLEIVGAERCHWGEMCLPCRIDIDVLEQSVLTKVEQAPSLRHITDQAYRQG